jgi:autotransporter-associated beta strand protein
MKNFIVHKAKTGLLFLFFGLLAQSGWGQTSYTSTSATNAWNASRWNNSSDASPYTSAFTANNAVNFTSGTYNFAGMGATVFVGNVSVASGVTVNFASTGSTFSTNGNVRTFDIASGGLFNFNSQNISTGTLGFIKSGGGTLYISSGSAYTGGFTLDAGTMVIGGVNALGSGGTLSFNGGTLCASSTKDLSSKFTSITVGGNVQFGEVAANAPFASTGSNITFSNNMSLGSSLRTLTLGGSGTITFGGVISNSGSNGLTFTANSNGTGRFDITGTNTFSGPVNINGNGTGVAEVRFTSDGSLGNTSNTININGGRLSMLSGASYTLTSGRGIQVGNISGTSISTPGATGVLTYNGVISDLSGATPGAWAKQGSGKLSLGGVSTYLHWCYFHK